MAKDTRQLRKREHFQVTRQLGDLISIGPAMLRDFEWLGIRSVAQLARQNPQGSYARLNRLRGQRQERCGLDVFCAAVGKGRDAGGAVGEDLWGAWSPKRAAGKGGRGRITAGSR